MTAPFGNVTVWAEATLGSAAAAAPMPNIPSASRRVQPGEWGSDMWFSCTPVSDDFVAARSIHCFEAAATELRMFSESDLQAIDRDNGCSAGLKRI